MSKIRAIVAALLMAAGFTLTVPAGEAQAVWDCSSWAAWPNQAASYCSSGLGGHRVRAVCFWPNTGAQQYIWGPWKLAGQYSVAYCWSGSYIINDTHVETGSSI